MVAVVVPEKEELLKKFTGDISDLCEREVRRGIQAITYVVIVLGNRSLLVNVFMFAIQAGIIIIIYISRALFNK